MDGSVETVDRAAYVGRRSEMGTRIETAFAGKSVVVRRSQAPRILLDTNIWNYLADADLHAAIKAAARRSNASILVAPAALYEAFEFNSAAHRKRRAKLLTDPAWVRLMPEAYSECGEILGEIRRLAPRLVQQYPNLRDFARHRRDWKAKAGGAWDRAAQQPDIFAELSAFPAKERAIHLAQERRKRMGNAAFSSATFQAGVKTETSLLLGGPPHAFDAWRVEARNATFWHCDRVNRSPYFDWLQPFLTLELHHIDYSTWSKFWLVGVMAEYAPRFWLRWALEYAQSFQKVSNGAPGDSQIGTHLLEADYFLTSDRRFAAAAHHDARPAAPHAPADHAVNQLTLSAASRAARFRADYKFQPPATSSSCPVR